MVNTSTHSDLLSEKTKLPTDKFISSKFSVSDILSDKTKHKKILQKKTLTDSLSVLNFHTLILYQSKQNNNWYFISVKIVTCSNLTGNQNPWCEWRRSYLIRQSGRRVEPIQAARRNTYLKCFRYARIFVNYFKLLFPI